MNVTHFLSKLFAYVMYFPFSDYYNSKDLHIGVTNSHGCVVEFSEEGIRGVDAANKKWSTFDSSLEWDQCLLLEQFDELWNEIWDSVLLKVLFLFEFQSLFDLNFQLLILYNSLLAWCQINRKRFLHFKWVDTSCKPCTSFLKLITGPTDLCYFQKI